MTGTRQSKFAAGAGYDKRTDVVPHQPAHDIAPRMIHLTRSICFCSPHVTPGKPQQRPASGIRTRAPPYPCRTLQAASSEPPGQCVLLYTALLYSCLAKMKLAPGRTHISTSRAGQPFGCWGLTNRNEAVFLGPVTHSAGLAIAHLVTPVPFDGASATNT